MDRRKFISLGALGALAFPFRRMRQPILPPLLREGDTVALIAPGSAVAPERLDMALANLSKLGLRVKEWKYLREKNGYLAGLDDQRLEDLHEAFADPTVRGVWCARGGYGCTRLLDRLDWALIRNHPKPFIGFSDITALHAAFNTRCGMVTFHAQVAATPWLEPVFRQLQRVLFEGGPAPYTLRADGALAVVQPPSTPLSGRLVGGNLALLAALAGTPYSPSFRNSLVFIEDVGERPYRIDRMLTQLMQASDLRQAQAVLLGRFAGCEAQPEASSWSLRATLADRLDALGVPYVGYFPFGHVAENFVVPCGASAVLEGMDLHIFTS